MSSTTRVQLPKGSGALRAQPQLPARPVVVAAVPRSSIIPRAAAEPASPFSFESPMDDGQRTLSSMSTPVLYAAAALATAAAGAAGYTAGSKAPEGVKTVSSGVGAVVGVGAAAFAAHEAVKKRASAASIELWNTLAAMPDPEALQASDVEAISSKYGFVLAEKQAQEVKGIYDVFLEGILPKGEAPLRGDEHERARRFLSALGLSDEDAAAVHIDVGRRFTRAKFESKDRQSARDGQRQFQKLIYVSAILFGEAKSAYLLPWKRLFGLTDAQIIVAKRDNAKELFAAELARLGGALEANREMLAALREFQTRVRLADDVAIEVVQEAIVGKAVKCFDKAVECIKRRGRRVDYTDALDAVAELQAFNDFMGAAAAEQAALPEEERTLVPGLAAATASGTEYDGEKRRELRDLYKVVAEQRIAADGAWTQELADSLKSLADASLLGTKEAEEIRCGVVTAAYKKALRAEVQSGALAAAESPAAVLQGLCEKVAMQPEDAAALHESLYRQKLETLLEDKMLTDEDATTLDGLRKMLCIPRASVKAAHLELCGRIYRVAVQNAMGLGIDNFSLDDRSSMRKTLADVRLESEDAVAILKDEGRKQLMTFVNGSRLHRNRLDAAKELKKMVFFSNMVLSPLLETTKSEEDAKAEADAQAELQKLLKEATEAAAKEEAEEKAAAAKAAGEEVVDVEAEEAKAEAGEEGADTQAEEAETEESEGPSTLSKASKAAKDREAGEEIVDGSGANVTVKAQKDITLAEDLDLRDRQDIYRNYLLYCMSGDVVSMPMGGQIVLERDEQEFARLSQLGDILGLQQMEVMEVHTALSEQAFRAQAQGIAGDGMMTPEKAEKLDEMRKQMGLSEEAAAKIIKGVQNEKMIKNMQANKAQGAMTLEKVMDLKESGVDITNFVTEDQRVALLRDQVEGAMTSGAGDFDEEFIMRTLPGDLGLSEEQVEKVVTEYAADRRRTIFVQAASVFRQKKMDDTIKALNNYVAATTMLKATDAPEWRDREELMDMYALYVSRESDALKQEAVQAALHLTDEEAKDMRDMVTSGNFDLAAEDADAAIF